MSRDPACGWLARVPDPRLRPGRRHLPEFVPGLAACAFTAAGHDWPTAIAGWAAGCSQDTLANLGGRRDPRTRRIRPPGIRTSSRVFGGIDADAFNAAPYGYLAVLPASPPGALPLVTRHEREQRRAAAAEPGPPGLLEQAAAGGMTSWELWQVECSSDRRGPGTFRAHHVAICPELMRIARSQPQVRPHACCVRPC